MTSAPMGVKPESRQTDSSTAPIDLHGSGIGWTFVAERLMSLGSATWRGRHKRVSRRLLRDLRTLLPIVGVLFCFASSATVIMATEKVAS